LLVRTIGTEAFSITLFEGPPDPLGVLFDNGMRFHGADIVDDDNNPKSGPYIWRQLQTFKLRLWWSVDVDKAVSQDYQVAISAVNPRITLNVDSVQNSSSGPMHTSQWITNTFYMQVLTVQLPAQDMSLQFPGVGGDYTMNMTVLDPQSGQQVSFMSADQTKRTVLQIGGFAIKTW
jgi:hypothetical protein